ncbi:MAG: hypothetical protein IKD54_01300 [Clostridia bacterium]|nr:hypothetical protein [Clostridia bacterium]
MKRIVIVLLVLMLLPIGCIAPQQTAETETPAPTDAPTAVPETPAPTATPEPTEEPEPQPPYVDARKPYTCIMTDERDRKWEEDVVFFADTYLDPYHGHALITDRIQTTAVYDSLMLRLPSSGSQKFFDPALKARFIEKINELILSIPERTDDEIVFGIWEAAALLKDLHAYVGMTEAAERENLPFLVMPIQSEDGLACVIDACKKEYAEQLLGRRLIAINGFTLAEMREKLKAIIHYETDTALDSTVTGYRNCTLMSCAILRYIGVMDAKNTVRLTVLSRDGERSEVEIESLTEGFNASLQFYRPEASAGDADIRLAESDRTVAAWYRLLQDGEALYLRINQCNADDAFGMMLDDAFEQAKATGKLKKVIIDVRGNPGGYPDLGGNYLKMVDCLNGTGVQVYVLINNESYSGAIALPCMLCRRADRVQMVGTPGGQPVRFFYGRVYELPNSSILFKCSRTYADYWPEYGDGPLMPEVLVDETWDDYLNGVDSVLKYVLDTPETESDESPQQ